MSETPQPPVTPGGSPQEPVPAGTPASAAAPAASRSFSIGEAVGYGFGAFGSNLGVLLLAAVLVALAGGLAFVSGASGIDFDALEEARPNEVTSTLASVGGLLSFLIGSFFQLGLWRVAAGTAATGKAEFGSLFSFAGYLPYLLATILFGFAVGFGLLLCLVPGLIVMTVWVLYPAVIGDRGNGAGALGSLAASARLTRGHRLKLLWLLVVLSLLNLLGIVLVIGTLVTIPVAYLALTYAYRRLGGQQIVTATA